MYDITSHKSSEGNGEGEVVQEPPQRVHEAWPECGVVQKYNFKVITYTGVPRRSDIYAETFP